MANLRQDIINKLGNDKYFTEIELVRQGADPNMVYLDKVEGMSYLLKEIAALDLAMQLVGKYFPAEAPQGQSQGEAPKENAELVAAPQPHQGQSHGE